MLMILDTSRVGTVFFLNVAMGLNRFQAIVDIQQLFIVLLILITKLGTFSGF